MYDKNERYTIDAEMIDHEVACLIRPVFEREMAKGKSIRQVSHVIQAAVSLCELEYVLDKDRQE